MLLTRVLTGSVLLILLTGGCGESPDGLSNVPEALLVEPPMVSFGPIAVGSSSTATVAARNAGPITFRLQDISTSSTSTAAFRYAMDDPSGTERYRGQASIVVTFAPSEPGEYRETIEIGTRGPARPGIRLAVPQPLTVIGKAYLP